MQTIQILHVFLIYRIYKWKKGLLGKGGNYTVQEVERDEERQGKRIDQSM